MGAVKRENLLTTSEFIIMKIGHHVRPLSNRRRMASQLFLVSIIWYQHINSQRQIQIKIALTEHAVT